MAPFKYDVWSAGLRNRMSSLGASSERDGPMSCHSEPSVHFYW